MSSQVMYGQDVVGDLHGILIGLFMIKLLSNALSFLGIRNQKETLTCQLRDTCTITLSFDIVIRIIQECKNHTGRSVTRLLL